MRKANTYYNIYCLRNEPKFQFELEAGSYEDTRLMVGINRLETKYGNKTLEHKDNFTFVRNRLIRADEVIHLRKEKAIG